MWHSGSRVSGERGGAAGLMLGLDDLGGSNCYYSEILCYKLFNIVTKKVLLNLKDSCVPLSSWRSRGKPRVLYVLLNIVRFPLLWPLQSSGVLCMHLYPSDQHTRESQVLSVTWESQIDLRLAAVNVRTIPSHPVHISPHWSRPKSYTLHWRHALLATNPLAGWQREKKKEKNKPWSAAVYMFDSTAGNSWAAWHPSWWQDVLSLGSSALLSLLTDAMSETVTSLFSPEHCNCLSVPKECSQPGEALWYPTQHHLLLSVLNSQGTIFFSRLKES